MPALDVPVAMLVDLDSGRLFFAEAPQARRPIASLTKLMTALLVLERLSLDHVVEVSPDAVFDDDDFGASSTLGLRAGERRTVRELLYALLLQSANDAAVALAIEVGVRAGVRTAMNRRADTLGMHETGFFSPNGLDDRGRSSARDLLLLVQTAYATPGFAPIVATKFRRSPDRRDRSLAHPEPQRAALALPGAIGVKTGSTTGAGYCLVAVAERDGRRLVAIVLGSPNEAFSEAATLLDYGFEAFTERTFVEAGQDLGTVEIRGGAVTGVAGGLCTASSRPPRRSRAAHRGLVGCDLPACGRAARRHREGHAPRSDVGTVPIVATRSRFHPTRETRLGGRGRFERSSTASVM